MAKSKPKTAQALDVLNQVVPEAGDDAEVPVLLAPHPTAREWTDWVLAQLRDDEAWESDDGRRLPYAKGLRRFARTFLNIAESVSRVASVSDAGGGLTVAVEHTIQLAEPFEGLPMRVSGVCCRGPGNLSNHMSSYPAEVADTVAEGRALTRLLGLSVVTKDELKGDASLPSAVQTSSLITPAQVLQLRKLRKVADLDPNGFVAMATNPPLTRLEDMSSERFQRAAKFLSEYSSRRQTGAATPDDERVASECGPYQS